MNTEHIDIGLARYSDWAFTTSVIVLVGALLLLAVELAYTRSRKVIERETVNAGVPSSARRGPPASFSIGRGAPLTSGSAVPASR